MKKYIIFFALSVLFFTCKEQPKNNNEKTTNKTEIVNKKYDTDQFRRFTYFLESENPEISKFLDDIDWEALSKQYEQINSAKVYQKDNGFFFVYDVDPTLNNDQLISLLKSGETYSKLYTDLQKFPESKEFDQPLERIFKMEQKAIYSAKDGQLKKDIGDHKRFVWTLSLQKDPEMMAEYKRIHRMDVFWPQIISNMKTMGIKDMEIYLYGTRAMLIMDAKPGFDMAVEGPIWQKLPREMEWQNYVSKFQHTNAGSGIQEKWLDMIKL